MGAILTEGEEQSQAPSFFLDMQRLILPPGEGGELGTTGIVAVNEMHKFGFVAKNTISNLVCSIHRSISREQKRKIISYTVSFLVEDYF